MTARSQAERDRMTVEIAFALFTGALLGLALFLAVALPVLMWDLGGGGLVIRAAGVAGVLVGLARVVVVLRRSRADAGTAGLL